MGDIRPVVDIAFKKLFGVEENKDLLISLINSIVSREDQVMDLTLLNPYNSRNFQKDKLSILDIKAKGKRGKLFDIEVQISDEADYDKRALYYWAKLYTDQLKQAQGYGSLSKAIGIHLLNFTSIPGTSKYHNVFRMIEEETGVSYFEDIELHTIELNKFPGCRSKDLSSLVKQVHNTLDRWLAFLTQHPLLKSTELPQELNDTSLKKALDTLVIMNFSPEERELYEGHLKWLMIEENTLKKAEAKGFGQGFNQGKTEGFNQGKTEGFNQGKTEGKTQGMREEKKRIAKSLLAEGESVERVLKWTGLTFEEVKEFQVDV